MDVVSSAPKISIGVDPEFFAHDKNKGILISAHELVPGTKEEPHPLENGAVQVDGVAIEFNTKPAYTAIEFAQYTTDVMKQIRAMVPDHIEFVVKPAVIFDKFVFDKLPDKPKELGCSPDYNVWSKTVNPPPAAPRGLESMRTGSGHVHIGWTSGKNVDDPSHKFDCDIVGRAVDMVVGAFLKYIDRDTLRQKLYGKAGTIRVKPYGIEWRTPSNEWLNHPELYQWLFDAVHKTVTAVISGKFYPDYSSSRYTYWDGNKTLRINTPAEIAYGSDTVNNGYYDYESTLKAARKMVPDFPAFPEGFVKVKKAEPATAVAAIRVAPTSSTTTYDVNLDIPEAGQQIPVASYLSGAEFNVDEDYYDDYEDLD